jgi:hypothetical protein
MRGEKQGQYFGAAAMALLTEKVTWSYGNITGKVERLRSD